MEKSLANKDSDIDPLREWGESAPYWEKHAAVIRTMFTPLTRALIDDAEIGPGQHVLDVAGGPGEPSLTIAMEVGPSGAITCTDAIFGMVQAAYREAKRRRLGNTQFAQCIAESLPFNEATFDRVVCRLGSMFFRDVSTALYEILRVMKTGGKMSFVVWGRNDLNPFSNCVTQVLSRYFPPVPAIPGAHDAFRFAEPAVLADLITKAGALKVRDRLLDFRIEGPVSIDEFWGMRSETSETLRNKLARLSPEEQLSVANEVKEAVRPFFPNDRMSFPAQMRVITGTK